MMSRPSLLMCIALLVVGAPAAAEPDSGPPEGEPVADPAAPPAPTTPVTPPAPAAPAPAAPAAPAAAAVDPARGLSIARKCDKRNGGFGSEEASVEMVLVNAGGDQVQRKLSMKSIETDEGDRSLLTFEWPPDIKGTRLLTHTHPGDDDDQWLYLSSMRRTKRISARSQAGAFMGSEFSFEDLGSQEVSKYTWTLEGEESVGGRAAWKLVRVPTNKRSSYSRQVVWMDKAYCQPLKIDYFDRKKAHLKTMTATGFTKQETWWRPQTLEMVNHQTHKKSFLKWTGREMQADLDEDEFDPDALED